MTATKLYRATVDGKGVTMLALSGAPKADAEAYCRDIFGKRMTAFQEEVCASHDNTPGTASEIDHGPNDLLQAAL